MVVIVAFWKKVLEEVCFAEVQKSTEYIPGLLVFTFFFQKKFHNLSISNEEALRAREGQRGCEVTGC